ncbi:chitin binding protein, partial [Colletotrichum higginsianum]
SSKDIWDSKVEGKSPANNKWLHIEHDPVYQTVYNLTDHMLESLFRNGFRSVTVGDCLNDPKENWYRSVGNAPPASSTRASTLAAGTTTTTTPSTSTTSALSTPTGSLTPSKDGRCGPKFADTTCINEPGATCCSAAGWCGNTADHCGAACQPLYGNCQISSAKASTSSVRASSASTSRAPSASSSTQAPVPSSSRTSTSAGASGTPVSPPLSTNGRCGTTQGGTTCIKEPGATCCSKYGWCGATADHCGAGCQAGFGTCSASK